MATLLCRYEELTQQFEAHFTETTGFIRCFTQDAEFNYIEADVQLAWELYLCGHKDAHLYIQPMLDELSS